MTWKSHLVRLDPAFERSDERCRSYRVRKGRIRHMTREQCDGVFLLCRRLFLVLEPELLESFGPTGQDDAVDVTGNLDRVVEFAELGHVHPHPGPTQVFTHTVESQLDDLADAAPTAHLDRPDVGKASVIWVPFVKQPDVRRLTYRTQDRVTEGSRIPVRQRSTERDGEDELARDLCSRCNSA
jgi:hypothetical protein